MIEISNFLSENLNDYYNGLVFNAEFPWYYSSEITNAPVTFSLSRESFPFDYRQTGFHHTPFVKYAPTSQAFPYFSHLSKLVEEQLPENPLGHEWSLYRVRCGFNIPPNPQNKYEDVEHNTPHVDHDNKVVTGKTYTCLYYLNDTDGDTFIFNEKVPPAPAPWPPKFTIKHRVNPTRNKLLIFDGDYFHASSSPRKHNSRVVLTFNYHDRQYEV